MEFERLYQELANDMELFRALVTGITEAEAHVKPTPKSWSVVEVLCHLADEEREDFREHLDFILNRPGDEWARINPGDWVTERSYHAHSLAEALGSFTSERNQSLKWLKSLPAPNWETEYANQFGRMKAGDMFAAWVAHDNLHMRQLIELRRERLVTLTKPYHVDYAGEW